MQNMTLEQLRSSVDSGGILSVTLKAEGGVFYVNAETRRGDEAVLVTTKSKSPRSFTDPRRALMLLRELGIREARLDAKAWSPEQSDLARHSRPDRAVAMKQTHEAVEHDKWFREQVEIGLKSVREGRTRPANEFFNELEASHADIPD